MLCLVSLLILHNDSRQKSVWMHSLLDYVDFQVPSILCHSAGTPLNLVLIACHFFFSDLYLLCQIHYFCAWLSSTFSAFMHLLTYHIVTWCQNVGFCVFLSFQWRLLLVSFTASERWVQGRMEFGGFDDGLELIFGWNKLPTSFTFFYLNFSWG